MPDFRSVRLCPCWAMPGAHLRRRGYARRPRASAAADLDRRPRAPATPPPSGEVMPVLGYARVPPARADEAVARLLLQQQQRQQRQHQQEQQHYVRAAVKHCGLCPQCVRSQQTVTTSNNLSAPCCRLYQQQADYVRGAAATVAVKHCGLCL